MNPFEFLGIGGPASTPGGPAPTAAQNIMNDRGLIGGFGDAIWGAPLQTRQANAALAQGQEENAALQTLLPEISRIREQNPQAQPHEIMKQIISSPTFNKAALTVPAEKMTKFVGDLTSATQKPNPQPFAQGNSYGTRDPVTGQVSIQGQTPTADMQNFQYWSTLPPEVRSEWQTMKSSGARPSDKAAAISRRVARGEITQEQADFLLSQDYTTNPVYNEMGEVIGREAGTRTGAPMPGGAPAPGPQPQPQPAPGSSPVPNPTAAPTIPQPPPGAARPNQLPGQGQTSAPVDPNEPPGQRASLLPNKADMFDAVGPIGSIADMVTGISGNIDPGAVNPQQVAKSKALDVYRTQVQSLNGTARTLKVEHELYDRIAASSRSFFDNPGSAAITAHQLRESVDARAQYLREQAVRFKAGRLDKSTNSKNNKELQALEQFQLATPTTQELQDYISRFNAGKAGTPLSAIGDALPSPTRTGEKASEVMGIRPHDRPAQNPQPGQPAPAPDLTKLDDAGLTALIRKPNKTPEEIQALKAEVRRRKGGQ